MPSSFNDACCPMSPVSAMFLGMFPTEVSRTCTDELSTLRVGAPMVEARRTTTKKTTLVRMPTNIGEDLHGYNAMLPHQLKGERYS